MRETGVSCTIRFYVAVRSRTKAHYRNQCKVTQKLGLGGPMAIKCRRKTVRDSSRAICCLQPEYNFNHLGCPVARTAIAALHMHMAW
jgi:hypothetical protein